MEEIDIVHIFDGIVAFCSIVAIVISIVSLMSSKNISQNQIKESRKPEVNVLNYQMEIPFVFQEKHALETQRFIDFESVDENVFSMRIPLYNIGVGVAKNSSLEIDKESMTSLVMQCFNVINNCCEQEDDPLAENAGINVYEGNFSFIMDNRSAKVKTVRYSKFYNHSTGIDEDYDIDGDIAIFPFILPVSAETQHLYYEFPLVISKLVYDTFVLSLENQRRFDELLKLSFRPIIRYEDMDAVKAEKKYELSISPTKNYSIDENDPVLRIKVEAKEL